jgi:hypothetical protein
VQHDIWQYGGGTLAADVDLTGFRVEAVDGSIGKVDAASNDVGVSYIVVDTGPWIFGHKVILPAGTIDRVHPDDETIYVRYTKDQIKNAPEYDADEPVDDTYRSELGGYYGSLTAQDPQQTRDG